MPVLDGVDQPHDVTRVRIAHVDPAGRPDEVDELGKGRVEHVELEMRRDGQHVVNGQAREVSRYGFAHVLRKLLERRAEFLFVGDRWDEARVPGPQEVGPPADVSLLFFAHLLEQPADRRVVAVG